MRRAARFACPRTLDVGVMEPPVTVVADVHLSASEPDVAARFAAFLETLEGRGGHLVLLGDIFDWWVGPKQARRPFEGGVIRRLARVADSGVRLSFVVGNRDVAFEGAPGLEVVRWPDAAKARWGSRTVLLTHGDLLCTADTGYLRMRRVFHSAPFEVLWRSLPHPARTYVAEGLRDVSVRTGRKNTGARRGIDYGAAAAWMEAEEADVLVAGHVHTGVHHVLAGPRRREVYVLKDWDRCPNAVVFDGERITFAAV